MQDEIKQLGDTESSSVLTHLSKIFLIVDKEQ